MTAIARRLRALIALAGLCACVAACGAGSDAPDADDVTATESAVAPPNVNAQADAVWAYYTGGYTGARPSMTMFQPDINCSPLYLGNGKYAYRIPSVWGMCLWDLGSQNGTVPYDFYATYEIWQDRIPAVQQPWYATAAVNFMCVAAYRRAGWTDAQLAPKCSGDPTSTVPFVRRWIHDTYYAGQPFWQ